MKKKRILLALPLPPPYSGQERLTQCLLQCGIDEKFELVHLDTSFKQDSVARGKFTWTGFWRSLWIFFKIAIILLMKRPDILQVTIARNKLGFLRCGVTILVGKLLRTKIVARFGGDHFNIFYSQSGFILQKFILLVFNLIDTLIVEAEVLKKQFLELFKDLKLQIVYNGIPVDQFVRPKVHNIHLTQKHTNHILFVGYISKAKGAFDLMKAIPLVTARFPNTHIYFVGELLQQERNLIHIDKESDLFSEREKIVNNLCIDKFITITKTEQLKKLKEYYWKSDIFVLPSYSEGFPFVVLEAMAAGLPLIVTKVGALDEVLTENVNAFFVKTGEPDEIAEKIIFLFENEDIRRSIGRRNYELVKRNYNLKNFKNSMERVWDTVLCNE